MENWRAVVGYEGIYEVSDLGRVRSLNRVTSHGHRRAGRVMRPVVAPRGYVLVNLWRENRSRMWLVHRLVLTAFVGEAPPETEGRHLDGDSGNNALTNLMWGTHSENQYDQVTHGTHKHAAKDECPAGHPYDEANTYIYPGRPHRGCRTCRRDYSREYARARRRAA
jgi:hypothetical protein